MLAVRPEASRSGGSGVSEELARRVAGVTADELAVTTPGRVAVLAPAALVPTLWDALRATGLPAAEPGELASGGLTAPLVLLAGRSTRTDSNSTRWWWSSRE